MFLRLFGIYLGELVKNKIIDGLPRILINLVCQKWILEVIYEY